MSGKQITVLITAVGGSGTIEILKSLRKKGNYRLVGVDSSPYARGFSFCDQGYTVPLAIDSHFKDTISKILIKEQPEFIIPLVDEEILLFHDMVSKITPRPKLLNPKRTFCEVTLDKWQTYLELARFGLNTPETILASQAANVAFPSVIKPRDGRGSREVGYLASARDLELFLAERTRPADRYIIQRRVFGREFTVSVVVGLDGRLLAVVPKEVVVKKGITQVGVTRNNAMIERLCQDVQKHLQADGPFNVQLMLQEDGTPSILEINPRYSTTVALTLAAGIDEVEVIMRHALNENVEPLHFQPDLMMLRYQSQMFMPENEWPPAQVKAAQSEDSQKTVARP